MSNEIANQLLARVQEEMARNITAAKKQLAEWLERPESGGVTAFCAKLAEVGGSLSLLSKIQAAELTEAISSSVKALDNQLKNNQIQIAVFRENGAEIASALLLLSDYIAHLSNIQSNDTQQIVDTSAVIRSIATGNREQVRVQPKIDRDTYQALAAQVTEIIDISRNQIEQYALRAGKSFDAAPLIEQNKSLISLFGMLNLSAPQFLLREINRQIAEPAKLQEKQWINIAEAMILVEETLQQVPSQYGFPESSDFASALQAQSQHSRSLEVRELIINTAATARQYYENLRKKLTQDEALNANQGWKESARLAMQFSAVYQMTGERVLAKVLQQFCLIFAELSQNQSYKTEAFAPMIDALVGVEYIFSDLADTARTNKNDVEFLKNAVEVLGQIYPITQQAKSLVQQLIHLEPSVSESSISENDLSTSENLTDLLSSLDALEQDYNGVPIDDVLDTEEEEEEALPVVAVANTVSDSAENGGSVGVYTAYLGGKSIDELANLGVPSEKSAFVESHADAVMDDEIREFFIEELDEKISEIQEVMPSWQNTANDINLVTTIRRAFHTIKGSGRTVGYEALGECAWQHEQLLNRVIDKCYPVSGVVQEMVFDTVSLLQRLRQGDDFIEQKGALLTQAAIAEQLSQYLLDHPDQDDRSLHQVLEDIRKSVVSGNAAAGTEAAVIQVAHSSQSMPKASDAVSEFDGIRDDGSIQYATAGNAANTTPVEKSFGLASDENIIPDAVSNVNSALIDSSGDHDNSLTTGFNTLGVHSVLDDSDSKADSENSNELDSANVTAIADKSLNSDSGILSDSSQAASISISQDSDVELNQHEIVGNTSSSIDAVADDKSLAAASSTVETQIAVGDSSDQADIEALNKRDTVAPVVADESLDSDLDSLSNLSQATSMSAAGYFAGRDFTDLDKLTIPATKIGFTESHSDAVDDAEIKEFFLDELDEKIQDIRTALPQWREMPRDEQYPADIRRAFHTIKGSGRTVGYESLGEFAYQHERLLNGIVDKHYDTNFLVQDTVEDAVDLLKILRTDDGFIEHKAALLSQALIAEKVCENLIQNPNINNAELQELAKSLREASDQTADNLEVASSEDLTASEPVVSDNSIASNIGFADGAFDRADAAVSQIDIDKSEFSSIDFANESSVNADMAPDTDVSDKTVESDSAAASVAVASTNIDSQLADQLSATLESTLLSESATDDELEAGIDSIEQQIAAHASNLSAEDFNRLTQQISANLAGRLSPEDLRELLGSSVAASVAMTDASTPSAASESADAAPLSVGHGFTGKGLSDLDGMTIPPSKSDIANYDTKPFDDPDLKASFFEELDEKIKDIDLGLPQWRNAPRDNHYPAEISRAFHTIKGGGRTVGYESLGEFAHQHELLLNGIVEKHYDTNFLVQDTVEDAVGLLKILRTDDGFIEHKAALLSQALIAEKVCENLTKNPHASDAELQKFASELYNNKHGTGETAAVSTDSVPNSSVPNRTAQNSQAGSPAERYQHMASLLDRSLQMQPLDSEDEQVLAAAFAQELRAMGQDISDSAIQTELRAQLESYSGGQHNQQAYDSLLNNVLQRLVQPQLDYPAAAQTGGPAAVNASLGLAQTQYQHMADMLSRSLKMQPLDADDEKVLADAFAMQLQGMGLSVADEAGQAEIRAQLQRFADIQGESKGDYEQLLGNILNRLTDTKADSSSSLDAAEMQRLAAMTKQMAADGDMDDADMQILAAQLQQALPKALDGADMHSVLQAHLSSLLGNDTVAQTLLQQTLHSMQVSQQETPASMQTQSDTVASAADDAIFIDEAARVSASDEAFVDTAETPAAATQTAIDSEDLFSDTETVVNIASSEAAAELFVDEIATDVPAETESEIALASGDSVFVDAGAGLPELNVNEDAAASALQDNSVETAAAEVPITLPLSDRTLQSEMPVNAENGTVDDLLGGAYQDSGDEGSDADDLLDAIYDDEPTTAITSSADSAVEASVSTGTGIASSAHIDNSDAAFHAEVSTGVPVQTSLSSANRPIVSGNSGNRKSIHTERLSQELSNIAQHPTLQDAVGQENQTTTARGGVVGFLSAVDHFDTLSHKLEQDSSPEMIDSLIESVYDIEDALDPGGAPNWIWRMLDAIEQLLLSYKADGSAISLSAASILRQSADLIENYGNDGSEEEAAQTINSLMSARQQLQQKKAPESDVVAAAAVPVSNEYSWDEWIEDPNAGSELAETFLDEAVALFGRSQLEADRWDSNRSQITHLDTIRRDMHTLKGSARMAGYLAIGDLTHAVESMIESIVDGHSQASSQAGAILSGAMWQGMIMLDSVRDGFLPQTDPYILNNINRFLGLPLPYPEVAEAEIRIKEKEKADAVDGEFHEAAKSSVPVEASPEVELETPSTFDENIDPVLVDIFSDEAQELIDQAESLIADDLKNPEIIEELKRNMHTLKGGARLVGMSAIGDTSHLMESVIEQIPDYSDSKLRQAKNLLNMGHEALYSMLDSVLRREMPTPAKSLNQSLEIFAKEGRFVQPAADVMSSSNSPENIAETVPNAQQSADAAGVSTESSDAAVGRPSAAQPAPVSMPVHESESADTRQPPAQSEALQPAVDAVPAQEETVSAEEPKKAETASQTAEPAKPAESDYEKQLREKLEAAKQQTVPEAGKDNGDNSAPAEVQRYVRVDANLLDEMIAMIGETAIMRSRMENVSSESEFNLTELTRIATRIDEQMRRLDNETEAQMLFRRETQEQDDGHFDPLEMDRFSEIQQLSRQLAEAIDDLKNVQDTLAHENTLMRNLSMQQGVIQRGIQERLLTTQLIRFDVNEARLKRLVRQTAKSVGKEVNFLLEGGQVELERRLIEDVLPAIEHMVRNSIGHGIETPQERTAAGKSPEGTVKLIVESKASNVEIRILDDGRGFDYDRIREKARSKGWLPDDKVDDIAYLNSLMMRSGFSTAAKVTQLSGRGVGMDVVNEMVKQRRGQLIADSIPGKGAQFTILMPFSMSIAEVLLVEVAGQSYAVPMNSIAAVNHVEQADLQRSAKGEEVYCHYDGMDYRLYVLGNYFKPRDYEFAMEAATAPTLFINAGGEPVALFVDRISNRIEIIVKNVNRQVLNIPGISGATILGDGHVVPVLELLDLSRRIGSFGGFEPEPEIEEEVARNVLVVDDSVTMRKVSTRLLERNGYTVETAKDGLDAIDVLQHFTPDLILLDIEMPRMDGFEFAAHVRQESEVPEVPIIMVTSRTGDKHRERADQIGVQGYLGKPYREDVLIETIESLIGEAVNG